MCDAQTLRVFIQQRLNAAGDEIFDLFERIIAKYEERLCGQQKLLDTVVSPHVRLDRADVQLQLASRHEVPPEQQEWIPSLDQDDPTEPPHIKEEQEELWTNQEGERIQGLEEADITRFTFIHVPVKSEEGNEGKPQSSHFPLTEETNTECGGEDYGDPDPDRNFNLHSFLQPDTIDETSHPLYKEETSEPQSGSNLLRNDEEPGCNAGKRPVGSSGCSTSFGRKRRLQEHGGIQMGMKAFSCSICGKRYNWKSSLTAHMRVHTEGKSLSCSVCKNSFSSRDFERHMRVHSGEKPFSCSVCGKGFAQKERLTEHTRIHTGEKPFSCSFCDQEFRDCTNFRRHLRIHTGEKPFICSVCGKGFARKERLTEHARIHTGEKPFSCSFCEKEFGDCTNFRRHMRIHTGNKPFSCSACDKGFSRLAHMKRHKCVGDSSGSKDSTLKSDAD